MMRSMRFRAASLAASSSIILVAFASAASAAPGDLDTSFGDGGRVTTEFSRGDDGSEAIVLQDDGKIVVAGGSYGKGFALARYDRRGKLDPEFGRDGKVTTSFPSGPAVATGLALQGDGRVIAAGFSENVVALARYRRSGRLDTSFGDGGRVETKLGHAASPDAVAIQGDGRIVVAGAAGSLRFWFVARYLPDGTLDRRFGNGGWTRIDFGTGEEGARDVMITDNQRILVAGTGAQAFATARLTRHGELDPQFGNDGRTVTPFRYRAAACALDLQPDGRIVEAGFNAGFALVRYLPSGRLDPTFGRGGKVGGSAVQSLAFDVAIQPDGRIVAGGSGYGAFVVARYLEDGTLDPSFGQGGTTAISFGRYGGGRALALQENGRIVLAGVSGSRFAVARFLA
jgi:uncharacterized delta-60 repeat protein